MDATMKLVIQINNKRPFELEDLARSMTAIASEYRRHVSATAPEVHGRVLMNLLLRLVGYGNDQFCFPMKVKLAAFLIFMPLLHKTA